MKTNRKSFHHGVRKLLAVLFWAHAIGATKVLEVFPAWNRLSGLFLLQASLITAILFYAYIAKSASWSMIADALYVYVSPVIFVSLASWSAIKAIGKPLAKVLPSLAALYKTSPEDKAKEEQAKAAAEAAKPKSPEIPWKFRIFTPVTHFSALWCLLIALSNSRWLIVLSTIAALTIAIRSIASMHFALNEASTLFEKIGARLRAATEEMMREVTSATPDPKKYEQAIKNLRVYANLFQYLDSLQAVRRITRRFSLAVAIPAYMYTSLLCGFAYFGIALLYNVKWPLGEALIDALYMPIAFTDLPHIYLVRVLAGAQVASLILIGYDAIFRSINENMERLSSLAHGLSGMIEQKKIAEGALESDHSAAKELQLEGNTQEAAHLTQTASVTADQ